jgi:hypothetical protein
MKIEWLFAWYNLIFIVPFLLAMLYVGVYSMSGLTFGDPDADADGDVDTDAHVEVDGHVEALHLDADADADADAHVDPDAHVDADADHDHEAVAGPGSILAAVLSFLGVGRVPLSILLMVLLLTWGMIGFILNYLLWDRLASPALLVAVSISAAAIGSSLCTRLVSSAITRWLPLDAASVPRRHDLLGAVGEVILPIDGSFGMASVRDERKTLLQVPCRRHSGDGVLEKGDKVRFVAYNGKQRMYYVVKYDPAVANRTA